MAATAATAASATAAEGLKKATRVYVAMGWCLGSSEMIGMGICWTPVIGYKTTPPSSEYVALAIFSRIEFEGKTLVFAVNTHYVLCVEKNEEENCLECATLELMLGPVAV